MLDPTNAQAYNKLGSVYRDKGDLDRAIANYDEAVARDPRYADPYYKRGRSYFEKGDVDRAIADYGEAVKLNPNFVDAYNSRGLRYSDKGDLDHAIADFGRMIALAPKRAEGYGNRCWARLVASTQLQEALSDCNESLRIRPGDSDTLNSRALLYLKAGKFDEAIADFTAAIQADAKFANSMYGRGLAKLKKGDAVGGQSDMATAEALDPDVMQELARYGIK
jgi:tetratricopeptide (TPR) repeat protein